MGDIKNKTVNIYIDQSAAEAALDKLQSKADGFNKKIEECRQKQAALNEKIKAAEAAGTSTTKLQSQYNSLEKQIAETTSKLDANASSMKKVQQQIDSGLRPSLAQTEKLVTSLRNQLKQMSEDAPGYAEKFKAFESASAELNRMRDSMNGVEKAQTNWMQQAKVVAFGVLIGNTIQQAIAAIGNYLSGIVTGNAKLSDTLADLQRVTGATKNEVRDLYNQLKQIDTRTSTSGLLDIAIVAGKLGIAKNEIASFTQAVDKLQVALGDELGDADQITEQLGKILNVFDGEVNGQNITKLGNAIVDLGNKGIASGPFLVDFAQRVSGVAKAANLSLPAVIGLASGLEASGHKVESSSTAVQKLITDMGTNLPKAAQIANVPLAEFQKLFADKPQEALLQYAAGLQKNKASFAEVAASFKDAGEDGARTIAVLATLGVKTDYFRQQMEQAGVAIQNTDEIQDAFNLKNQTLGAELEKLGKSFNSLITSKTLSEFFASGVRALNNFVDALKAAPQWIRENQTGIALLIAGLLLMNETLIVSGAALIKNTSLKIINATTTKLLAAEEAIANAARVIYITTYELLTGAINLSTAATKIWAAVTTSSLGPIGALVALIGAIVIAVNAYANKTKELTAAQQVQAEVQKRIAENAGEEKKNIQDLLSVATDLNNSYESRKAAIDKLISINPDYLGGLDDENTASQRNIDTINDYITHLDSLAKARALVDIKAEAYKKKLEQDINTKQVQEEGAKQNESDNVANAFHAVFGNQKIIDAINDQTKATNFYQAATKEAGAAVDDLNSKIKSQEIVLNEVERLDKEKKVYRDITGSVIDYTSALKALNDLKSQRNILQGLPENTGLKALPAQNDTTDSGNKQQTLGEYKAFLKNKIDELQKNIDLLAKTDEKGRAENLAQQKKYQDELDALNGAGYAKQLKHDQTTHEELLKAAEEFNKKIRDLQNASAGASKTQNQKEVDDIKHKYDEVLLAYNNLVAKLKGTNIKLSVNAGDIKGLENAEIAGTIKKQQAKDFEKQTKDEYAQALADSDAYFASLKQKEAQRFVNGNVDYKTYKASLLDIDERSKQQSIRIADDYAAAVKGAESDVTKFKKEQLEAQVAAMTASFLQREKFEKDLIAFEKQTEFNHAQTQYDIAQKGTQQQYEAQKKLINLQHADFVANLFNQTDALIKSANGNQAKIADINASFNQQLADADAEHQHALEESQKEHIANMIDQYLSYASQVVSIFDTINQARNAKDEAAFNAEASRNNKLKNQYQSLLNGKLITQQEYNIRTAALDAKLAKDKEKLDRKEFERNKATQIANTIINGAEGIVRLWVDPGFPAAIPMAVLLGALTAAQVGLIAAQKPNFGKGGKLTGPSHSDGGMPVINPVTGRKEAEVEGGEYILSKNTVKNNRNIADALLHTSLYNGGAAIDPDYFSRTYKPIAVGTITKTYQTLKYAAGGVFPGANNNSAAAVPSPQVTTDPALLEVLNANQQVISALAITVKNLHQRIDEGIEANVSLKKLSDAQDQNDRILADADFKQG